MRQKTSGKNPENRSKTKTESASEPSGDDSPKKNSLFKEYRTIVPYLKEHKWKYFGGLFFLILTDAGHLYIPLLVRNAVDEISTGAFDLSAILRLMLVMVGIALAVAFGRLGWRYFLHGASRRIEASLRETYFNHLLTLSSRFFGRMKTGDLMARATNDLQAVRMASGMGLVAFIDGFFMSLAILLILFTRYPKIALFTIIPLPFLTALILWGGRAVGSRFRAVQEGFSSLSEWAQETFAGIRVIKAFVREDYFLKKFGDRNDEYKKRNMSLVRIWGLFFPLVTFLSGLTLALLLLFGGRAVIAGTMSTGDFVAFLSYLQMLIWPMMGAAWTVNIIQRGGASLKRLNEVLEEKPDITGPTEGKSIQKDFSVKIQNLQFRYPENKEDILKNVSFHLSGGETLGILGRTGSGKSTLIKLIPRLLDTEPGIVQVGGIDVHDWNLEALRHSVGMVMQNTFLFSATIAENIAFGNPDLPREDIEEMAGISTVSRDLALFPEGYETQVGEKGVSLSGGQKQRIAISRALAVDPPILVLDDSLSAVDTETEKQILDALFTRRKGKTNIIISHRVSTLERTDRILVLDKGTIVQDGTHERLIDEEGLYQEIYTLQQLEEGAKS